MSSPLSIGIACYPSFGGSGVVAAELAVGLAQRGHLVHLIATAAPGRALPACDRLHFHPVAVSDYPLFDHAPYESAMAAAMVEVTTAQRLDLLQVHYAVPHAASAYLARQVLGGDAPRIVTTLHGTDVTGVGADPSYRSVTRFALMQSDGLTAPSHFLRDAAYAIFDLPPQPPIEVIANFVDTDHFAPAAVRDRSILHSLFDDGAGGPEREGPILFHVSNFRAVKRTPDLIEVLQRLRRHVPARLVLVGDGPQRADLAQRAHQLDLSREVCFLGQRPDFAAQLCHADGFLLPSESESFGVAALEALSAGVPVFGYRVGGLPEVVTDEVGVLVEPFDVDALTRAVLEVVSDPARSRALGRAGRQRALDHFRREPAVERYEAYFRRVLAQPRAQKEQP
jgi:N-acetyl-alpha-D-glucosaminyl L-malate synthase BshA